MTTPLPSIFKRLKVALFELLIAAAPMAALYVPFDTLAQTQAWPNRVVKIVVLGNPGNAPDIVARILAEHLSATWGQGVIIDNRPAGPGGNLAAQYVAQAAPDGYTLKMAISPQLVMNPFLFKTLGYDAERDFAPIVRIGAAPMMLSARRALFPLLAATFALKLLLAAFVPFSGDEAYFLIWGQRPDFGFYDHPPMVGWLLWLMLRVSEAEWVLRLPVVLFTSFIGYGLYHAA